MKLPNPFKAKSPALPVSDWIDHAAVQTLQDQTQAAIKINEPLQRLVALKTVQVSIAKAEVNVRGLYRVSDLPLTAAGLAEIQRLEKLADKRMGWGGALTMVSNVSIGAGLIFLSIPLGIPLLALGGFGVVAFGTAGGLVLTHHVVDKTKQPLQEARELPNPLTPLLTRVSAAIHEIESTLSLEEARQSDHFDAALKVSPSLRTRFGEEAVRAFIRDDVATPVKIIKKTGPSPKT